MVVNGIDLSNLPIGTRLIAEEVEFEVTQIGKECHDRCHIYYSVGDCIMPREGVFCRVLRDGGIFTKLICKCGNIEVVQTEKHLEKYDIRNCEDGTLALVSKKCSEVAFIKFKDS